MTPKIALDTNAYRALDDGEPEVANYLRSTLKVGLPIIVLGEIYHGIFLGSRQEENNTKLNKFISLSRVEILHVNKSTTKLFGEIAAELKRIGKPMQQNDLWIAALCKQYDYALLSADKGFSNITGLELISFNKPE